MKEPPNAGLLLKPFYIMTLVDLGIRFCGQILLFYVASTANNTTSTTNIHQNRGIETPQMRLRDGSQVGDA